MPPKKQQITTNIQTETTSLKNFLFKIRDICRNNGVQMDENGNIYADLIYDDLLFLKDVWMLEESGDLNINKNNILDGFSITNLKLDSIASLKENDIDHVKTVFNRLWTELKRSNLKDIFDRDFALFGLIKDEKLKNNYPALLYALLDYVGKVNLQEHEDTDPYEYFSQELKKGKSKYFGQFYTPQILTECCVNEIKPKMGELGLDPAAGTGKFMRTAAEYIAKNNSSTSAWDAYQHMRMVELEAKIYRQGILGTFIKYKKIPNMNYQRKGNSFDLLIKEQEQFDYILANPPYGGTVDGFDEIYHDTVMEQKGKRMVPKKIVKPTIIYPFDFIKKDTCVLFLQLIVNKLKKNGRAAVIFNATIMNDQHRDVLEWFLQNCNLYKMIVNPSGTFKCTGIETYSFIFTKGTPTQKIEYYEFETNKKLGELTLAQIEERGWNINPKFHVEIIKNIKYDYQTIDSLIDLQKSKIQASKQVAGPFLFVSTGDGTHNEFILDNGKHVFISDLTPGSGIPKVKFITEKCSYSTLLYYCKIKTENIIPKFLYYYIKHLPTWFKSFYMGIQNAKLNKKNFLKEIIPLPPLPIQQEIVANLDRIFADPQDMKDCIVFTDKAMDLMLKDPTGKQLEDVLGGLRDKRDCLNLCIRKKSQMAAVVRSVGARGFERKKLGDICEFNTNISKHDTHYGKETGLRPFYTGAANNKLFTDTPDIHHPVIIMNRTNGAGKCNLFIDTECAVAGQAMVFYMKDKDEKSLQYLYHYLNTFKTRVEEGYVGSNHKNISNGFMEAFEVEFPPLSIQHEVLAILNEMEAELQTLEQMAAKAEQRAKFILDGYLTSAPMPVAENVMVTSLQAEEKPVKKRVFKVVTGPV